MSGAGSEGLSGALFYQTPAGIVLASPTMSSDGYILGVPGTSALALPPTLLPGASECFLYTLSSV